MICFLFGREPLLIKPAPFFRPVPTIAPEPELPPLPWHRSRASYQISGAFVGGLWGVNLTLDDGGLYMIFAIIGLGALGEEFGKWLYKVREKRVDATEQE